MENISLRLDEGGASPDATQDLSRGPRTATIGPMVRLRKNTKVDLIARVPLFAESSKAELGRVAGIADEIGQAAGSELIRQGARGGEFCVLVDGTVEVRSNGKHCERSRAATSSVRSH